MNLTLDQYLKGLEETCDRLPGVLDDWEGGRLDEVLCDCYPRQLEWLLKVRGEVQERGEHEGRGAEVRDRLTRANARLATLQDRIKDTMGVEVGCGSRI